MTSDLFTIVLIFSVISNTVSLVENRTGLFNETVKVENGSLKQFYTDLDGERCDTPPTDPIESAADLVDLSTAELLCRFHWGVTPDTVPIGYWQGTVINVFGTGFANPFLDRAWDDKMTYVRTCKSKFTGETWDVFPGINHIFKVPVAPFVARIDELSSILNPEDYDDGGKAVIVDYNQDYKEPCNFKSQPNWYNPLDIYSFYDALRIVGRTAKGGAIYLGKGYGVRNPILGKLGVRKVVLGSFFATTHFYPTIIND